MLFNTFRVAAALKTAGIFVGMGSAYSLTQNFFYQRWQPSLILSTLLFLWLLPWPKLPIIERQRSGTQPHAQLIVGIALALFIPPIELILTTWIPFPRELLRPLGWSVIQINNVHALGLMFLTVPVVLAGWQYGRWGMSISLGLAGLVYVIAPFWMPVDAFIWHFYVIRGFVLLGVTLILAFTTTLLAEVQRQREAELAVTNQQLYEANHRLTEQTALIEEVATSRERTRLARELHDTLAHALSGTAVQLQAVGTLLSVDPALAGKELKSAQRQIKEGLEESRRAISALRATPLTELGLAEALRERVVDIGERTGIATTVHLDVESERVLTQLSPLVTQTLYRIADEALLNAEQHAQADHLQLRLSQRAGQLELRIEDNGQGFERAAHPLDGHYGILGMQERANMVGGVLEITYGAGQGTTICFVVPMERKG